MGRWRRSTNLWDLVLRVEVWEGHQSFENVTGGGWYPTRGDRGPYWFRLQLADRRAWDFTTTAWHATGFNKLYSVLTSGGLQEGESELHGRGGIWCFKEASRRYCENYLFYSHFHPASLRAGCIFELRVDRAFVVKTRRNQWFVPRNRQQIVAMWIHIVPDSSGDARALYWTSDWEAEREWPYGAGRSES